MSEDAPQVYTVPVSPGRYVHVAGPWPLTDGEWERLLMVLSLFEPGLVKPNKVDLDIIDTREPETTP